MNTSQLTCTPDGAVEVHTYDWQSFLSEHLNKQAGIKSFHHLRFPASNKVHVFAKTKSDAVEVDFNLLKDDWAPTSSKLPERLTPSGLSPTRRWYLYHKIREYCPQESQDITCPRAFVPEPSTATTIQLLLLHQPVLPPPLHPPAALLLGSHLSRGQGIVGSAIEKDTTFIFAPLNRSL